MGAVTRLGLAERVRLDPDRLVELCVAMGEPAAEALVTASIEDISYTIGRINVSVIPEDRKALKDAVTRLVATARNIGFITFVRVGEDVLWCLETEDFVAFAATFARLNRVAAKAQTALWDLNDMMV